MEIVTEVSNEGFAPRTRKATAEALTQLEPALAVVRENTPKVVTIVKGVTPAKSASLVSLLNGHYGREYTFGARTANDGTTAIVQAKYDPANPRVTRTVNRKPKATGATPKGGKGKQQS